MIKIRLRPLYSIFRRKNIPRGVSFKGHKIDGNILITSVKQPRAYHSKDYRFRRTINRSSRRHAFIFHNVICLAMRNNPLSGELCALLRRRGNIQIEFAILPEAGAALSAGALGIQRAIPRSSRKWYIYRNPMCYFCPTSVLSRAVVLRNVTYKSVFKSSRSS